MMRAVAAQWTNEYGAYILLPRLTSIDLLLRKTELASCSC